MSALPDLQSHPKRPLQNRTRSAAIVHRLIPAGAAEKASLASGDAFRIVDCWLDLECAAVLEELARSPQDDAEGSLDDFPLAGLLCLAPFWQRYSSLPIVKALLIIGFALDRPELAVLATVAGGAAKSARSERWKQLLPARAAEDLNLQDALGHCSSYAGERLRAQAGLSKPERDWLGALLRWCELLSTGELEIISPTADPEPPSMTSTAVADDHLEDDALHSVALVLQDEGEPQVEAIETDEAPVADSDAPEAPDHLLLAPAQDDDDFETYEGGEARRARTGYRSALENQRLPLVNHQLAELDRLDLLAALRRGLAGDRNSGAEDQRTQDAIGILTLAHVSGQLVEQACAIFLQPRADGSYLDARGVLMRFVPPQANAWLPSEGLRIPLRAKATHLPLQLPSEIHAWLAARVFTGDADVLSDAVGLSAQAVVHLSRDWLTELRQQKGGSQTLGRVERWLDCAVYQVDQDHVPSHLICAINDAQPCPSAYYRAYAASNLALLHRQILADAGWMMPPAASLASLGHGWVGSNLNLEISEVRSLWKETTAHFRRTVDDPELPLHLRHNARELHEVFSLMFQTFHRAVSDPIESLEFIDLTAGRMVLDDKSQAEARAHRVIPLSSLAKEQCVDQVEHLRALCLALRDAAPDTSRRIATVLKHPEWRAAPFRFLLNERFEIVRITPAALRKALAETWPLPLNLARHFGSTWLLEHEATDAALCGLLGHQDIGTLDMSMLSPLCFDSLFEHLKPKLDELVDDVQLAPISSFLPRVPPDVLLPAVGKKCEPMLFGQQRRAAARARRFLKIDKEVKDWLEEQLDGRDPGNLTQVDVSALFDRVRRTSPNLRNYWACRRFESMRDALGEILGAHEELKLELPPIALLVQDVAHLCPLDCLAAARWLRHLRVQLQAQWNLEFDGWRRSRTLAYIPKPALIVLTLVAHCMVVDPVIWSEWLAERRPLSVVNDDDGQAWVRFRLPADNSRLYGLPQDIANLAVGLTPEDWRQFDPANVVALADRLTKSVDLPAPTDFWKLLSRVQAAGSVDVPGLILGFADGSCGSVSPEPICLEREGGRPPTQASVDAWEAERAIDDNARVCFADAGVGDRPGSYTSTREFRGSMSKAFTTLERPKAAKTRGVRAEQHSSMDAIKKDNSVATKDATKKSSNLGPTKRFAAYMEDNKSDLFASPGLPIVCRLTSQWIYSLAVNGQAPNEAYAPKTLKNYWYSWGLRVIEEFGDIHPKALSSAELEELYLQIVEDAKVSNREHLYAPMRNLHRYLVSEHGVSEIDWAELRRATGAGSSHVDANFVYLHEYMRALQILVNDTFVSDRTRAMQVAVLILLYRGGLRVAECLGLRSTDVSYDNAHGCWAVRIRSNLYRGLKTDSARRVVLLLETLDPLEEAALKVWAEHKELFAGASDIRPLFSQAAGGSSAKELFPRRVIALRVAQALRLATGDPSTRIHHCRHSLASRLLLSGVAAKMSLDRVAGADSSRSLSGAIRSALTSASDATRRLIWAVAVMLGHSSPITTLQTYFHGGHLLLARWCREQLWVENPWDESAEWVAFSCGISLRTMQKAHQRARDSERLQTANKELENFGVVKSAQQRWTRVPIVGGTPRVTLSTTLPQVRLVEPSQKLIAVDRIIDHARRFGRVDGLSDLLFVTEPWIHCVLLAAEEFALSTSAVKREADNWWIDQSDVIFREHEQRQVDLALEGLNSLTAEALDRACDVVYRRLVPASRMLVLESADELKAAMGIMSSLVVDTKNIQLLVPAVPQRQLGADEAQRDVGRNPVPGVKRPRRIHAAAEDLEGIKAIREAATAMGLDVRPHGRVSGARDAAHSRLSASSRVGLRIRENDLDRVRSSKVLVRVLATACVARMAAQRAAASS